VTTIEAAPPTGARPGLLRANVTVALGTLLSRLTGLLRVAVLAYALGLTLLADSYNLANSSPNILYELLLGGVLSATLVPLFTEHLERRDEDATSAVVTTSMVALVVLTVLAVVAAPLLIRIYQSPSAPSFDTTVDLARLILPEILFYGWMALGSAILNARRRFFAPAWAPIVNNMIVIVAVLVVAHVLRDRSETFLGVSDRNAVLVLLGVFSTIGIAVMSLALVPAMLHAGVRLRFRFAPRHPAVGQLVRLSGWTVGYVVANQVALVVVYRLAGGLEAGSLSRYVYAFTFFQLPHGLLAVSIMTTFGPELARSFLHKDRRGFHDQVSLGLRMTVALVLPASVAYVVLGRPLVGILLARGLLRGSAATQLADTLSAFAWGLVGFSCYLFVLRSFYARRDTRTPFLINVVENAVNVVMAVALVGTFGVRGLAGAFSIAYVVAAVLAFAVLESRVPGFDIRGIVTSLARLVLAGITAGLAGAFVAGLVGSDDGGGALLRSLVGVTVIGAVYVGLLLYLGAPELDAVVRRLRRRATVPTP
jgi:putative peptidoglycan lipid II flippase